MRVLVTNDDGIGSTGLRILLTCATASGLGGPGHDVLVAAPHEERSGSSASLTVLKSEGRPVFHETSLEGLPAVPCLSVEATPASIVMAAFDEAFGPPPELVLSGINHGPNTGQAILHSGTVGAALTAKTHGCPAIAISMASSSQYQWETAMTVGHRVLAWFRARALVLPPIVLNVNVPDVPKDELRGIQHASLAAFGAVQGRVGEAGEEFVTTTFEQVKSGRLQPGTDAALLAVGWATVTTLAGPCEADGIMLDGLTDSRT